MPPLVSIWIIFGVVAIITWVLVGIVGMIGIRMATNWKIKRWHILVSIILGPTALLLSPFLGVMVSIKKVSLREWLNKEVLK